MIRPILASLILVISLSACQKKTETANIDSTTASAPAAPAATTQFKHGDGKGVVRELHADQKSVVLDHNNIPDVMDAMAMSYKVDDAAILNGLHTGDSVAFTLEDRGEGNYVVTHVQPIAKSK
jgi:Cu/Ag efflux protein CusF